MKSKHQHWAVLTASALGLTGLASAANLGGEKYTYDGSGNIVEKSIDGQVTKLSYDASNKVTSVTSASKGSERISYDAAGRPVSYKDASGQPTRQLSYGYADKVMKANSASGNAEFFYNAEGQLVGKSVAGKLTPYTWDGNVIAAEGAEAFTNEAHITGGVPIIAGNQIVVVSDYLGNTLSLGNQQFTSTAYGDGLESGRFTGKLFVEELGNYIFHYRLYSAETSRWNTTDPLGFPDGRNNYAYVGGDPLCHVDPLATYSQLAYVNVDSSVSNEANTTAPSTPGVQISCNILFGHTSSPADEPKCEVDTVKIVAALYSGNTTSWTLPAASVEEKGAIEDVAGSNGTQAYWNNVKIKGTATYTIGTTTQYSDFKDWKTNPWEK